MVDHVPVLSSRIPGSVGLLGTGYPGYFPVRDTDALVRLLVRAESDREFYGRLKLWVLSAGTSFPAIARKRTVEKTAERAESAQPVTPASSNAALRKTLRFAVRLGKESRLPE